MTSTGMDRPSAACSSASLVGDSAPDGSRSKSCKIARHIRADEPFERPAAQLGDASVHIHDHAVGRDYDTFARRIDEFADLPDVVDRGLVVDEGGGKAG